MTRSKKIFAGIAFAFFVSLIYLVYDISRKTTFPGSRPRQEKVPAKELNEARDSVKSNLPANTAIQQP
jgi:hypothetical protein